MFPIITLSGEPRARGRHYGKAAAARVDLSIATYSRLFAFYCGRDWDEMCTAARAYLPVLEQYAPTVLEEMHGIAEGAGRRIEEIVALNARTELLAGMGRDDGHPRYAGALARNRRAGVPDHGECTTLAALPPATGNNGMLLAQTWDWYGYQRAACVLLRIEAPGRPAILTLTEAGIVAKIGLNSAGLGLALNILFSNADGAAPGMPVHVLLRQMLEAESVAQAVELAGACRAGGSSCITVADARGAGVSLEITPGGIGLLEPSDGLLVHTNHCVTEVAAMGQRKLAMTTAASSSARFARGTQLLAPMHGHVDAQTLITVLRDHENGSSCICRHPLATLPEADQVESVTAVVMDLAAGVMFVAPGLPCEAPFTPVTVSSN